MLCGVHARLLWLTSARRVTLAVDVKSTNLLKGFFVRVFSFVDLFVGFVRFLLVRLFLFWTNARLVMQPPDAAGSGRRPAVVDSAASATDMPELRQHEAVVREKVRKMFVVCCLWFGDYCVVFCFCFRLCFRCFCSSVVWFCFGRLACCSCIVSCVVSFVCFCSVFRICFGFCFTFFVVVLFVP